MTTALEQRNQQLAKMTGEIRKLLPDHVSVEKFERVTRTAIRNNSKLVSCNRDSLFGAVLECAQDGLLPDGKEAAIVPFGSKAQYMPMVKGILKRLHQSGDVKSINTQVVCENDQFDRWIDETGEHFEHRPAIGNRGEVIAAYAHAITTTDGVYLEVMDREDIDKVRSVSRGGNRGPWADWFREMARKSALRRLSKRLLLTPDNERVIGRIDRNYDFDVQSTESRRPTARKQLAALEEVEAEPEHVEADFDDNNESTTQGE